MQIEKAVVSLLLAACAAASSAAVKVVPYGSDPQQVGDLFLPEAVSPDAPVVLNIHGGGWGAMSRKDAAGISRFLVERGCAVYSIDYRLAGAENPWPACGKDCLKAAEFMLGGGLAAHGVKPARIWIIGASAGGHLALWTGLSMKPESVAGIISVSGIADPLPDAKEHPKRYQNLFGGREPAAADFDSMSIMRLVRKNGPRILLTHAKEDTVVPFSSAVNFYNAYNDTGSDITFRQYSTKDEANYGGHCIWRKSLPIRERLLCLIEDEVSHFMRLPGIDVYSFAGEDFGRMFAGDGWQAAILNNGPKFGHRRPPERHMRSDELFVLLQGEATLFIGEEGREVKMEKGRLYNVRRGTWHQIVAEKESRVLVVENTGDIGTEQWDDCVKKGQK